MVATITVEDLFWIVTTAFLTYLVMHDIQRMKEAKKRAAAKQKPRRVNGFIRK